MNAQWGLVARLLYKLLRPRLKEIVMDSENKADDTILQIADYLAGVTDGKG